MTKLTVFGTEVINWNLDDINPMFDAIESIDVEITTIEEIAIHKGEISFICYGREYSPLNQSSKDEILVYYFNVVLEYFNNGGADFTVSVNWPALREFYKTHAQAQDIMINAIDNNMLIDAQAIHSRRPDVLPSLSDSFYARWLVKTNNIKFLEWAKSVDDNIDFSPKNKYENPLKIAIYHKYQEVAIWLLDNYPEIALSPSRGDQLEYILDAKKKGMDELVEKMRTEEMMELIIKSDNTSLLPDEVQDIFVF